MRYIIMFIKSKRMKQAGHVEQIGRREMHTGFLWENITQRDHSEGQSID